MIIVVYVGDIDKEDLDWVNGIVNSKLGAVVSKITGILARNNGSVKAKDVIEALVKKT